MCILSYLPPDAEVDLEGLMNGGFSNPDGHGWAIASRDGIVMRRTLNLDEALSTFAEARVRHAGPALFHSRWATHGTVNVGNVHPFLVGGSHKTVVAHNGILPVEAHPLGDDDRSDTRKFADEILPRRFRRLDKLSVTKALSKWCGAGNKLAILTVDPRYQSSAYLINQNCGEWDELSGVWHSNADYRLPYGRWTPISQTSTPAAPGSVVKSAAESAAVFGGNEMGVLDNTCRLCGIGWYSRNGYCDYCKSCEDCNEWAKDCQCWSPNASQLASY